MQEQDPNMEELTISQASQEFRINRGTITNWLYLGKIPSRMKYDELGVPYRVVARGEITKYLQNKTNNGRPLKRT